MSRSREAMGRIARHGGIRFRRHFRKVWESRGGGFYGFVAALTFVYLEALDLAGDAAALPGSARLDLGWGIGWLVEGFVDALLNLLWAALWPVEWIGRFGVGLGSAALLAGAYLAYRLVRPTVLRLLREPGEPEPVETAGA